MVVSTWHSSTLARRMARRPEGRTSRARRSESSVYTRSHWCWRSAQAHRLAARVSIRWKDLAEEEFVSFGIGSTVRELVTDAARQAGVPMLRPGLRDKPRDDPCACVCRARSGDPSASRAHPSGTAAPWDRAHRTETRHASSRWRVTRSGTKARRREPSPTSCATDCAPTPNGSRGVERSRTAVTRTSFKSPISEMNESAMGPSPIQRTPTRSIAGRNSPCFLRVLSKVAKSPRQTTGANSLSNLL